MNAKAKGTRNERGSMRLLEAAGYAVTRAATSLEAWDIIAVSSRDVVLHEVKTRDWPGIVEMETLRAFAHRISAEIRFTDGAIGSGCPTYGSCHE
jgi:Holliday junction resolvase